MAIVHPSSELGTVRRRYVKAPATVAMKERRDQWIAASADVDPLAQLLCPMLASHRLSIGRYRDLHWYASLVSDIAADRGGPNAVSGWGDTPFAAVQELSFRWHICMCGSWDPRRWNMELLPVWIEESEEDDPHVHVHAAKSAGIR